MSHPTTETFLILSADSDIGTAITSSLQHSYPDGNFLLHSRSNKTQLFLNADLSEPNQVEKLCTDITAMTNKIDWIIYVTGYITTDEKEKLLSNAEVSKTYQINTFAFIDIVERLDKILAKNGGVLAISSSASLYGNGDFPIYASSKAALNIFCKSLKKRWSSERHVYVVCPGGTNTKMRQRISTDASEQQSPDTVADLVNELITTPSQYKEVIHVIKDGKHEALAD